MKTLVFALISLCAVAHLALAQERQPTHQDSSNTGETPRFEVEPLVITATRYARPVYRVPYAVDLLNQDDIQHAEVGLSLEEALRSLPGVVVQNRYNLSQGDRISLRGIGSRAAFGVRGLKLIQDGIPLTMADGQSQLNNIDLGSAGQVEVLRGPSSSLYGNAAGGLISLQTQTAVATPFQLQPRLLVGADGLRKWEGKASGQVGRHQYLVNVNSLWQEGYRDFANARSTGVNAVGHHVLSQSLSLTTVLNAYNAPYLLNPSSLAKAEADTAPTNARLAVQRQGASKKTNQTQGGITLQYRGRDSTRLEATVYGLGRSLFNPIPGRIIDLDRKAGGLRTVWSRSAQVAGSTLRWTAGADVEVQRDARQEFGNGGIPAQHVGKVHDDAIFKLLTYGPRLLDQAERVLGVGPFVELELTPYPAWVITVGGRYDRYRFTVDDRFLDDGVDDSGTRTMDQVSPMVGLTYRPHRFISLYGNYATAFQTPTTTELSNRPTREGGFNPDLRPERVRSVEAGLKGLWPARQFTWDAAFYFLTIDEMLIPFQIDDPSTEEVFFRNAGKTRNRGIELRLTWAPTPGWRASFAYTLMDFIFQDFLVETSVNNRLTRSQLKGNDVPGVPPQHLYAGVMYKHRRGGYAEANLQWMDRYFANDFNGPGPGSTKPVRDFINDAYLTVDLRLGGQRDLGWVGIDVFVGVNNLFNTRYNGSIVPNAAGDRFFEPAAGRTWYTGVGIPVPHGRR